MKTIYKYPLEITDEQTISVPNCAEALCVQLQEGEPFIWFLVNTNLKHIDRKIYVFGTGNPIEVGCGLEHIDTFQLRGFVWHVFEQEIN